MTRARIAVLIALAVLVAALTAAGATASGSDLQGALSRALVAKGIDPRQTSALVVDLRTGSVVFEQRSSSSLRPASAEKLAVALAALRLLGPGYRFRTEVVGVGERRGGTWNGDLVLVGHGDPTLALDDVERLARAIRAQGIRKVTGRVLGDERHFDARRDVPGWKAGFVGIESRPLSALSVTGSFVPGVNASAASAARALTEALERRDVSVAGVARTGRAPEGAIPLATDHSPRLAKIVGHMNRESDNFYAELLLKELGATTTGVGTSAAGAQVVSEELRRAGVPLAGVRIVDGSGLSLGDRLTAEALVEILLAGAQDLAIDDAFVASLAVAGISGTLEDRLGRRPTRGRVIAKTGTTSLASALAGFVRRRYVFAILQNGTPVPYWTARFSQDRFVTLLAGSK